MDIKSKIGLLIGCLLITFTAAKAAGDDNAKNQPKVTSVSMFGYATSFSDSIVCVTEIQPVDSVWLEPAHKFLMDRSLYSLQLQVYLEQQGYKNTICTIFYDKNPRKLQRVCRKVQKRARKAEGMRYIDLPASEFRFKAEEYRPVIIEESAE